MIASSPSGSHHYALLRSAAPATHKLSIMFPAGEAGEAWRLESGGGVIQYGTGSGSMLAPPTPLLSLAKTHCRVVAGAPFLVTFEAVAEAPAEWRTNARFIVDAETATGRGLVVDDQRCSGFAYWFA